MIHRDKTIYSSKKKIFIFFLTTLIISLSSNTAYAENLGNSENTLTLGDHFFSEHNYMLAYDRYKEIYLLSEKPNYQEYACYRIGVSYFASDMRDQARTWFNKYKKEYPNGKYLPYIHTFEYAFQFLENSTNFEIGEKDYLKKVSEQSNKNSALLIELIMILKKVTERVNMGTQSVDVLYTEEEQQEINSILMNFTKANYKENAQFLLDTYKEKMRKKDKSIAASVFMSILLPGAGQLYSGYRYDAIEVFFFNAVFGSITAYTWVDQLNKAHKKRNYYIPIAFSTVSGFFYIVNLYNASNVARNHNEIQRKNVYEYLEKTLMHYVFRLDEKTLGDWKN